MFKINVLPKKNFDYVKFYEYVVFLEYNSADFVIIMTSHQNYIILLFILQYSRRNKI